MTTIHEIEKNLWEMADKLRGNIAPNAYKDVVLGLIFLKYISDSFEEKYQALLQEGEGFEEDEDAYLADNVFLYLEKHGGHTYSQTLNNLL